MTTHRPMVGPTLILVMALPMVLDAQSLAANHARTRLFNRALGVECTHCHVPDRWNDESKPTLAIARRMLQMVEVLNERLEGVGKISCVTCHGGQLRFSRQPREALEEQLARWPVELADAS